MSSGVIRRDDAEECARQLSARPVPGQDGWRELVVHAEGPFVTPSSVRVEGDLAGVQDLDELVAEGGGVTRLATAGARTATLIVDLGRVAMGTVEIGLTGSSGAPVRVSYAQFERFIGPDGDGMDAPFGTDAHPWTRVDHFAPSPDEAILRSPGKRETRYVAITLDGAGEAEIDFVRIRQAIYPVRYDGHFLCSDDLLNQAWYHSAYTGDLATISEHGSPWMLTVTFDRVLLMGDLHMQAIAGYYQSSDYRWLVRNTLRQYGPV